MCLSSDDNRRNNDVLLPFYAVNEASLNTQLKWRILSVRLQVQPNLQGKLELNCFSHTEDSVFLFTLQLPSKKGLQLSVSELKFCVS